MLAYSPPNRLHTSVARETELFRLIQSVSVRIPPSNPSNPIAARLIQPTVCCDVGAGAGGPYPPHCGGPYPGGGGG